MRSYIPLLILSAAIAVCMLTGCGTTNYVMVSPTIPDVAASGAAAPLALTLNIDQSGSRTPVSVTTTALGIDSDRGTQTGSERAEQATDAGKTLEDVGSGNSATVDTGAL